MTGFLSIPCTGGAAGQFACGNDAVFIRCIREGYYPGGAPPPVPLCGLHANWACGVPHDDITPADIASSVGRFILGASL